MVPRPGLKILDYWKGLKFTNTLAYYDMAKITAIKNFTVQDPGLEFRKRL
jgi:hypothetical protein